MKIISAESKTGKTIQITEQWLEDPTGILCVARDADRARIIKMYRVPPKDAKRIIPIYDANPSYPSLEGKRYIDDADQILEDYFGGPIAAITVTHCQCQ